MMEGLSQEFSLQHDNNQNPYLAESRFRPQFALLRFARDGHHQRGTPKVPAHR
jgi:hypothetical protein